MGPLDQKTETKKLYRASEFAELAGVTVRTLHHYDRLGLLKPSGRTAAGYRMYGEPELARLQQIVTLRFIGLSLHQIKEVLDRRSLDLAETLHMQREAIEQRSSQLQMALHAITRAEHTLRQGATDWEAFRKIVEVFEMEQNRDWTDKYYTPEARQKLAEKRAEFSPEAMARSQEDWRVLIAEVEQALADGEKPEGKKAQALAARWKALIQGFTGGDPQVADGLKKAYADRQNWPSHFKKPYSDEAGAFMCEAMKKLKS